MLAGDDKGDQSWLVHPHVNVAAGLQDWGLEELGSLASPPDDAGASPSHTRRPDLSTAVDNLMGLQQRAGEAVDKANRLQLIVDGPPQLEVGQL